MMNNMDMIANVEADKIATLGTLVRTDRNGTKIYNGEIYCSRCGGTGHLSMYDHVEGGVCFKCEGVGTFPKEIKVYTPEYAKVLEEKRLKAKAKKEAEAERARVMKLERWKVWNGFINNTTYLFLGNTYSIKDEIKALGAKYDIDAGWHIGVPVEGYETLKVTFDEVAEDIGTGNGRWKSKAYIDSLKKAEYDRLHPQEEQEASHYVGTVGENYESEVTLISSYTYETSFAYRNITMVIYTMADDNGNKLVWKTSSYLAIGEDEEPVGKGDRFIIKGKVKEHSLYKDEKQTVLIRCKAKAVA